MSARYGRPTEAQLAALRRETERRRALTHCRKYGHVLVQFGTNRACHECRAANQRAYRLRLKERRARALGVPVVPCDLAFVVKQ